MDARRISLAKEWLNNTGEFIMKNTICCFIKIIRLCLFCCSLAAFTSGLLLAAEKTYRNYLGMEFVLIPAGEFMMGSPPHEPHRSELEVQHKVIISQPFYMQTTEVTLKQWRALMGKKLFGRRKGTDDHPVTKVSWYDCQDFIAKLNARNEGVYRLPTEAEWEYACRAGTATAYTWGDKADCSRAMYANNRMKARECIDYVKSRLMTVNQAAPVKSYPPNAWGLYDMHGNVWEWCLDGYIENYDLNDNKDPRGPGSGMARSRRGGSWYKHGYACRSANRAYGHAAAKYKTTGFRVVREVQ